MKKKQNCTCGSYDAVVLSCSGASDAGRISDLVARKLRKNRVFKMSCLSLVEAGKKNGIENYQYLCLSDIGLVKRVNPATSENIELEYSKASIQ